MTSTDVFRTTEYLIQTNFTNLQVWHSLVEIVGIFQNICMAYQYHHMWGFHIFIQTLKMFGLTVFFLISVSNFLIRMSKTKNWPD